MPELPEVETIRRDLEERIINKKIKGINIIDKKVIRGSASVFVSQLQGKKLVSLDRVGKLLIFKTSANKFLLIHLKMTGQLIYISPREFIAGGHNVDPHKYTRLEILFSQKEKLLFNDLRRFGYLRVVEESELAQIRSSYGPEPLTPAFTKKAFLEALNNRRTNIKAWLLNQHNIAGIGNIYADESLFLSGIRPERRADSLKLEERELLYKNIKGVIRKAINYRGTTFRDYMDTEGKQGNFSQLLKVYGRQNQECLQCGAIIKKIKVAGRGTHYCPSCQK